MRLQLALDAVGVLADEDERARMPKDERRERRVGRVLAAPPQDENYPARLVREGLDRLDRGVHVRRLRVVVEGDAADLRHPFEPVLHGREAAHALAHRVGGGAARQPRGERRQSVLDVVQALQLHLVARDERALARPSARDEFAAPQEQAFVKLALGAEHDDMRFETRSPRRDDRIVRVQDGHVAPSLVAEDSVLGRAVVRERLVAIHVVGRQVQHHRHRRAELLDGFELVARKLDHGPAVLARRLDQRDERRADIAADLDGQPRAPQKLADERRGGRLPVRARDADDSALEEAPRQFDLADHLRARALGVARRDALGRHAGA